MFNLKNSTEDSGLEKAIDSLLADLNGFEGSEEDYATTADQLVKLYALKDIDRPKHVSPDTWAIVAANLLGIIVIVGYEQKQVVTSKAMSFLLKLR